MGSTIQEALCPSSSSSLKRKRSSTDDFARDDSEKAAKDAKVLQAEDFFLKRKPNGSHVCPRCAKVCADLSVFTKHYQVHAKQAYDSYACAFAGCDSRYPTRDMLKRHLATHGMPTNKCPKCDYCTNGYDNLMKHCASQHGVVITAKQLRLPPSKNHPLRPRNTLGLAQSAAGLKFQSLGDFIPLNKQNMPASKSQVGNAEEGHSSILDSDYTLTEQDEKLLENIDWTQFSQLLGQESSSILQNADSGDNSEFPFDFDDLSKDANGDDDFFRQVLQVPPDNISTPSITDSSSLSSPTSSLPSAQTTSAKPPTPSPQLLDWNPSSEVPPLDSWEPYSPKSDPRSSITVTNEAFLPYEFDWCLSKDNPASQNKFENDLLF